MAASSLVDLDRYPINRLDTPDGMALVERLRNDLENKVLAFLPDFLPPDVLERGIAEFALLIPDAHRHDRMRTPWGWMDNRGFPDPPATYHAPDPWRDDPPRHVARRRPLADPVRRA